MGCRKLRSWALAGRHFSWAHRSHHVHSARGGCCPSSSNCKAPAAEPPDPPGHSLYGRCRRGGPHARCCATTTAPHQQAGFVGMAGNLSLRLVHRLMDNTTQAVLPDIITGHRSLLTSPPSELSSLPSPSSSLLESPLILQGSACHILLHIKRLQPKDVPCSLHSPPGFSSLPGSRPPFGANALPQAASEVDIEEAENQDGPQQILEPAAVAVDTNALHNERFISPDVPAPSAAAIAAGISRAETGQRGLTLAPSSVSELEALPCQDSEAQTPHDGLTSPFELAQSQTRDIHPAAPPPPPLSFSGSQLGDPEAWWTSGQPEGPCAPPPPQLSGLSVLAFPPRPPEYPGHSWLPRVGIAPQVASLPQAVMPPQTAEVADLSLGSPFEPVALMAARGQPSSDPRPVPTAAHQPPAGFLASAAKQRAGGLAGLSRSASNDITLVPTVTSEELHVRRPLGSGSFGSVFMMKAPDEVGFTAMKVLDGLERGPYGEPQPEDVWKAFEHEWEACRRLRHRNIVRFERVFWYLPTSQVGHPSFGTGCQRLCIEMEYCSLGSLDKLLRIARQAEVECGSPPAPSSSLHRKYAARFARGPDLRLSVARQVAAGLDHMHSKGLVHRDLRATNIVLDVGLVDAPDGSTSHSLVAKLCDFGATRTSSSLAGLDTAEGAVMSPKYQAPEVLLRNDYGPQSDVFSFGVLLWELITMGQAWESASDAYVLLNVPRQPGGARLDWPCLPGPGALCHIPDLRTLVERCWAHEPQQRPSMKDVLRELKRISLREQENNRARRASGALLLSPDGSPPGGVQGPTRIEVMTQ